ncbi:beta-lactamase domain protein [Crinalium epipsammum PCC 9333]|uniref:Beta-lactamase domain protein n=1 Tax=Crinalium epipsammum PCC 9333 TaxID=1173022 RepID=K9VWQ9_9CYAN|nr:MBL fold metallo-hydrolase [Crinalium epipsammum]AFZ11575.1 beta-lactamase domain protein [Crinalium epipsammum PCC 9333]
MSFVGQKDLKITLLSALPEMKSGELWRVSAVVRENSLYITQAEPLEVTSSTKSPSTDSVQASSPAPVIETVKRIVQGNTNLEQPYSSRVVTETFEETTARLLAIAKLTVIAQTHQTQWVFSSPIQRGKLWEWEAVLSDSNAVKSRHNSPEALRARIQVNPYTEVAKVLWFDNHLNRVKNADLETTTDPDSPHKNRLIVTPLGAARSIGASCFRVLIGPYEIVLDAGTRPKGSNPLPAFEHLKNPNLILITHAHQDHIGALPVFHQRFPATPMICTAGTREIAHVMLTDCLKVQQSNEDFEQLFDEIDLDQTLFQLQTQPVGQDFEPLPGLKVRFIHAGHIVGAACVYIRYGDRSLLYTGDYNTTNSRTTDGLRLADLPQADILITESTYGADTHPSRKAQETELLQAVAEVVSHGGNVLIPAFALGRAQEIILAIRTSALFHKLKIPVYIDGLVRAVTDVFRDHIDFLPGSVQNFALQQEPFFDPDGKPPIIPIGHPRERPLAIAKPSVIIASSGMLSGGASVYYGQALLERDNAAIFISGYTDEESPGRFLQALQKGDEVEIEGKKLTVHATVRRFNLSAHADKVGLTQVIHRVNPKHLILIHGSMDALHELSHTGDLRDKYFIHIPAVGEEIEYGAVPEQVSNRQLSKIENTQEFEVTVEAEVEGAWLRIPESVLTDPRWENLSATGLLKAKWNGGRLTLSAVSALETAIASARASGEDCCAVCQFFNDKICQSSLSPLFSLQVDPRGKCMEFQRQPEFEQGLLSFDRDLEGHCDDLDEI